MCVQNNMISRVESESASWRGMRVRMRGREGSPVYALPVPCQRRFIRFEFQGCFIGKKTGDRRPRFASRSCAWHLRSRQESL